jgi:hypothetical protein
MSTELPLYGQEKRNTCALACLRMVLAAFDRNLEESKLEDKPNMEPEGTEISELERLARHFGLIANVQMATIEQLRQVLREGKFAITYIDRAVFDLTPRQRTEHRLRDARIHTVIPSRITAAAVTYHDPMPPARIRRSMRLFRMAYERLGSYCVVCARPYGTTPANGSGKRSGA